VLVACRAAFNGWKTAEAELERLQHQVQSNEDRAALLAYQLEELDDAAPLPGEFENTEQTHKRLSRAHSTREVVADALAALEQADAIGHAQTGLSRIDDDHADLNAARDTLITVGDLMSDATRDLRAFEESLSVDPESLQALENRLGLLHDLARKHRVSPENLPAHIESLRAELDSMGTDRSSLQDLSDAVAKHEKDYRKHAKKLTHQRTAAADGFCQTVTEHMNTLGIKGGALSLTFHARESEHGAEAVEYECITNPRYPAAPLGRIASGGERARISLAIQIVAAARNQLPSLILDEADVGVGGTTADVVGRLLRGLAQHTQVICITHAPQIAALGLEHLKVSKDSDQDTRIAELDDGERVDELARMLAGARVTNESRDYARTLLEEATS
jgi:DNA repair protein RecN (Recombination protein N)